MERGRVLYVAAGGESLARRADALRSHDFDVEIAEGFSAAERALDRRSFDCVLSEFCIDGRDAVSFVKDLRDNRPELPCVLLMPDTSDAAVKRAIKAGVTDYVPTFLIDVSSRLLARRIQMVIQTDSATPLRDALATADWGGDTTSTQSDPFFEAVRESLGPVPELVGIDTSDGNRAGGSGTENGDGEAASLLAMLQNGEGGNGNGEQDNGGDMVGLLSAALDSDDSNEPVVDTIQRPTADARDGFLWLSVRPKSPEADTNDQSDNRTVESEATPEASGNEGSDTPGSESENAFRFGYYPERDDRRPSNARSSRVGANGRDEEPVGTQEDQHSLDRSPTDRSGSDSDDVDVDADTPDVSSTADGPSESSLTPPVENDSTTTVSGTQISESEATPDRTGTGLGDPEAGEPSTTEAPDGRSTPTRSAGSETSEQEHDVSSRQWTDPDSDSSAAAPIDPIRDEPNRDSDPRTSPSPSTDRNDRSRGRPVVDSGGSTGPDRRREGPNSTEEHSPAALTDEEIDAIVAEVESEAIEESIDAPDDNGVTAELDDERLEEIAKSLGSGKDDSATEPEALDDLMSAKGPHESIPASLADLDEESLAALSGEELRQLVREFLERRAASVDDANNVDDFDAVESRSEGRKEAGARSNEADTGIHTEGAGISDKDAQPAADIDMASTAASDADTSTGGDDGTSTRSTLTDTSDGPSDPKTAGSGAAESSPSGSPDTTSAVPDAYGAVDTGAEANDVPTYERPSTLTLDPGTSILVRCASQDEQREAVCLDLLDLEAVEDRNVLLIRYRRMNTGRLERIAENSNQTKLITIGYDQEIPESVADMVETVRISNPNDVTRLGIVVTGTVDDWTATANSTVLCFDPLDALLQYKGVQNVFRFLHLFIGKLTQADVVSHFHVDPSAGNSQEVNVLKPLFDAVLAVQEGEARLEST